MALFSVNQNGQWFTAKAYQASTLSSIGDITIKSSDDTNATTKAKADKIWFEYKSAAGNKRSEVINRANHGRITVIPAAKMAFTPKNIVITYDTNVSATPVNGEVYGVYVNQRNYHGLGDRNFMELGAEVRYGSKFNFEPEGDFSTGTNYVAGDVVKYTTDGKTYIFKSTHSASAWNASHVDEVPSDGLIVNSVAYLMSALAQAFARNLGADDELYTITHNATSMTIAPKAQDWIQGLMQNEHFSMDKQDVLLSEVTVNTVARTDWATIAEANGTAQVNTKDIADMEWFYLGEHGDTQRLMGYPYVNAAQLKTGYYLVDPTNAYGYDLIIIHHAYIGSGNAVQKSEKDIMIALPLAGATTHTAANALLGALDDYFTGLSSTIGSATETIEF